MKYTIYNVGSPAFDEAIEPGWWRKSTVVAAPVANEQVIFPDLPPLPALATIPVPNPARDPAPAPTSADSHAASTVDTGEEEVAVLADREPEAEPAPHPTPDPVPAPAPTPRRSERSNRGVPSQRLAEMMVAVRNGLNADRWN